MIGSALFNGGKVDWRHVGSAVSCARHRGDLGSTPGRSGVMVINPPFSPSLRVLAGKLRGNKQARSELLQTHHCSPQPPALIDTPEISFLLVTSFYHGLTAEPLCVHEIFSPLPYSEPRKQFSPTFLHHLFRPPYHSHFSHLKTTLP